MTEYSELHFLEGTSQGLQTDIPPNEWIWEELQQFGVVGIPNVQPSNLTGEVHPIFQVDRWQAIQDPRRFHALGQSFILATKLLDVGMPWLASFLGPDSPVFNLLDHQASPYFEGGLIGSEAENPYTWLTVDPDEQPTRTAMLTTRTELLEIAQTMQWKEDGAMMKTHGWKGITNRVYPSDPPFGPENYDMIVESDARCKDEEGHTRRHLTVGIAEQYINALMKSEPNSEQHLCAAFHAAVTMVHEIAHVAFWQDFRNISEGMVEPAIGDECRHELGCSFIAHIFGGWEPEGCYFADGLHSDEYYEFRTGTSWNKFYTGRTKEPVTRRPLCMIQYSTPFAHIQRIMMQEQWDRFGPKPSPGLITELLLAPQHLPFRNGQNARKHITRNQFPPMMRFAGEFVRDPEEEEEDDDDDDVFVDEDWSRAHPNTVVPPPGRQHVIVTYAGDWDGATDRLVAKPAAATAPQGATAQEGREQTIRAIDADHQDALWKLGLVRDVTGDGWIRAVCRAVGISWRGDKSELYDNLVQFFQSLRETREAGERIHEPLQDDALPPQPDSPLLPADAATFSRILNFHTTDLETVTVPRLRTYIERLYHVAPNNQRLVLRVPEPRELPNDNSTLASHGYVGWKHVQLYRIIRPPTVVDQTTIDLTGDDDVEDPTANESLGKSKSSRKRAGGKVQFEAPASKKAATSKTAVGKMKKKTPAVTKTPAKASTGMVQTRSGRTTKVKSNA